MPFPMDPADAVLKRELVELQAELGSVHDRLREICALLTSRYGESSPAAYRAVDADCALQRLLWQLGRQTHPDPSLADLKEAMAEQYSQVLLA